MTKWSIKVLRWISEVIAAIAVLIAVFFIIVKAFNIGFYPMLNEDMEPAIREGSIMYVKRINPKDIKQGYIITFTLSSDNIVATRRVLKIDEETGKFYTIGDKNSVGDSLPVDTKSIVGTPVLIIPYLGYFENFVQNPPGMYFSVGVSGIVIFLILYRELLREQKREQKNRKTKVKADILSK